jgi:hypothetical protein
MAGPKVEPTRNQRLGKKEYYRILFIFDRSCYNRVMKTTLLLLVALALTPPLMASDQAKKAGKSSKKHTEYTAESDAINFTVAGAGGAVKNYHLEVPATAGKAQDLGFKVSEQAAALAAVNWAVGFYGASGVSANSVEWKTTSKSGAPLPFPYYLVNMTGKVGDAVQPLYAAVLENAELVRPVEVASAPPKSEKPAPKSKKA